jgi:hypothetical protein
MTEPHGGSGHGGAGGKLLTLSAVSKRLKISMPTLQRYKKLYQHRIPSQGAGRKQRYPESALTVFEQLRREHALRRGRPRKGTARVFRGIRRRATAAPVRRRPGRPPKAAASLAAPVRRGPGRPRRGTATSTKSGSRPNLLTLTQIRKLTGISYPTLVRYVRLHADQLPHEGQGRKRRFYPEAEAVFRQLRQQGGRGGRRKGSAGSRVDAPTSARLETMMRQQIKTLERSQEALERKLREFGRSLQKLFS